MAISKIGSAALGTGDDTGAIELPAGTTAQRPSSPVEGMVRQNTDTDLVEVYNGSAWEAVGDQTTTISGVDFLIVAGGGGGSQGGGGAGGYQYLTDQTITAGTTYTVTVGAGGAAKTNGSDSSISGLSLTTSLGGGRGGEDTTQSILTGGDGGSGGGNKYSATGAGGSGTSGQGNDGGSGSGNSNPYDSGGGGGAGAAASGRNAGNGLAPAILNTTSATAASVGEISGSDVYFSGGGGGGSDVTNGTGGLGGGGDGVTNGTPNNGTANTGGGSGGRNNGGPPWGTGGSGVVIIRLLTSDYSGTYTGSSVSVQVQGSDTLVIFKDSGTYTA